MAISHAMPLLQGRQLREADAVTLLSRKRNMVEITVGICEAFKAIGIDISEADLRRFEQALHERGLNVAPLALTRDDIEQPHPDGRF